MFLTPGRRAVPFTLAGGAALTAEVLRRAVLCCLAFTAVRLDWKGDSGGLSSGFSAPRTALQVSFILERLDASSSPLCSQTLPDFRGDGGDAGGGAQHRSAAADRVKRAGFVYERVDRPCLPH